MALPLLWLVGVVAGVRLVLAAGLVTSGAFVAGSLVAGGALVPSGGNGILPGTVGLTIYPVVGRFAAEVFARFVLRMHQLECAMNETQPPARLVPNLARRASARRGPTTGPASPRSGAEQPRVSAVLTARQLEAVLLARDGLRQRDIAACLGVSERQVERLMHEARKRAGAATTSQLIAALIRERLVPGLTPSPASPSPRRSEHI
jgi:DNA-binding CsgD family transcriptional regulator